jgi:hypothetical protein
MVVLVSSKIPTPVAPMRFISQLTLALHVEVEEKHTILCAPQVKLALRTRIEE